MITYHACSTGSDAKLKWRLMERKRSVKQKKNRENKVVQIDCRTFINSAAPS